MANVTRIKASDPGKKPEGLDKPEQPKVKATTEAKVERATAKTDKPATKQERTERRVEAKASKKNKDGGKKPFILFRPFVALFRYLRDAWREIRQVRWPNRKTTWKMVLAVAIYTAMFVILISLLDLFFTWLFSLILGSN